MDTPGSEISIDSPESSPRVLTLPESTAAHTTSDPRVPLRAAETQQVSATDDDDSASDVSMSADSDDDEDNEPRRSSANVEPGTTVEGTHSLTDTSKKRKWPESTGGIFKDYKPNEDTGDTRKRVKADRTEQRCTSSEGHTNQERPVLSAELWQHIFTFCHPRSLGRLLRVNKSFNAHLDPSSSELLNVRSSKSAVRALEPDAIWQASRRLFLPGMPAPTEGRSELDMWRLACSFACQLCLKKRSEASPSKDQWHLGPGENGVVPIWSFGIRTCGPCLQQQTSKEIDLLLSSSVPSPLLAALPFVFLTNELHIISPSTLQNGQHPPAIYITKHFFKQQVSEIKLKFHEAKALGSATVEEWLKGLENQGKERRDDAARWERWEASGGVARMLEQEVAIETRNNIPPSVSKHNPHPPISATNIPTMATPAHELSQRVMHYSSAQIPQIPAAVPNSFLGHIPLRYDSPAHNGFSGIPPRPQPLLKQERTKDEVVALKAARRAEIERRCMLLDPPLTAGVLAHMTSFQAAIQIIQPLDDSAWEVLKPRLLSQREEAEQRENDRLAQTRVILERYQDPQVKSEVRELVDKEWDDIQAPLRGRIGGYADEIIRDGWNGGAKVTKEEAPRFAAEVLIYVWKRFYAEVAKDEAAVRAAGREPETEPPNGPYNRKLTLENMKWVFDTKVKPYTEQHRKEIFLCSACENNFKYYGFEGVIQHYAAKHTSALSNGSIVVCWKSEWPDNPPFNPEPDVANIPFYSTAPGASAVYANSGPQPQPYGYGGYQQPVPGPLQAPNPHLYQGSPGPYYGHPQYNEQYMAHQNGPFAPPLQIYSEVSQGYPRSQYPAAGAPQPQRAYQEQPPQDYSHQGFGGPLPVSYPTSTHGNYATSRAATHHSTSVQEHALPLNAYAPQGVQAGQAYHQAPTVTPNHTQGPYRSEEYKSQLLDVARYAREVWNAVNNVKEVPGSIKVYAILHHLLKRSRDAGQDDPPLPMIIDGLSSNKDMRPIRNINGLLCKACTLGMPGSTSAMLKKHYSFPQLLNHFNSVHAKATSFGGSPDWTTDMIELPDTSKMASVKTAPGITDERLRFFTDALPEILAPPLPVGEDIQDGVSQQYGDLENLGPYGNAPPSRDNHEKYYVAGGSGVPSESASTPYDSNQYDPRNPRDSPAPPRDSTAIYRSARRFSNDRKRGFVEESGPLYRFKRESEEPEAVYRAQTPGSYAPHRVASQSSRDIQLDDPGRGIIREGAPIYVDQRGNYQATGDNQYRVQREGPSYAPDEPLSTFRRPDYRPSNSRPYQANRQDVPPISSQRTLSTVFQVGSDSIAQQNHIFEVVARISQQAQQAQQAREAQERQSALQDLVEAGSEDGELHGGASMQPAIVPTQPIDLEGNEADRFLNHLQPRNSGEAHSSNTEVVARITDVDNAAAAWRSDRVETGQRPYQPPMELQRHVRDIYDADTGAAKIRAPVNSEDIGRDGYLLRERAPPPRQGSTYAYDDHFISVAPEQAVMRERAPDPVDRRYKLNNIVYGDERQESLGAQRTPSRYARYESLRVENDRARSRSPVYIKMGTQLDRYRERSTSARPAHQEPVYRTRSPPLVAEEMAYERAPRHEYYRVYTDEPRPRQSQYAEAFEYVQVSDPRGDYMIRRPVRREPDPIYARYEDEIYARQPVYETRAPVSRSDPAYYEEYDPRHPAPPPAAQARQVRYQ